MWRMGGTTEMYHKILPDNVIPQGFPQWEQDMESFGNILFEGSITTSEMLAIGLGLPQNEFSKRMIGGCQILGPTGSDLNIYKTPGDVLAGFHYGNRF